MGDDCDQCIEYYEKEKRVILTKGSGYDRLRKFVPANYIYKLKSEVRKFIIVYIYIYLFSYCGKCSQH